MTNQIRFDWKYVLLKIVNRKKKLTFWNANNLRTLIVDKIEMK